MTVDELLKRMKGLSEDGYGDYPVVAPWGMIPGDPSAALSSTA